MKNLGWVVLMVVLTGFGALGTLAVQYLCTPRPPVHNIEARAISPDKRWEIVVEEYVPPDYGLAWRTFKICTAGDQSESPESVDGSIYFLHEYASGGIEISNLKAYWVGTKAIVASGGHPLLEWDQAHDTEWHMVPDRPTTVSSTRAAATRP